MVEPEKPFACSIPECGMTFTNEDHLNVHTKKHDMSLQLGMENKAAFVADQTPTPTRFIRNCEEVGLFQDLQNVNPFDEGFKRAMETKACLLPMDTLTSLSTEDLHTPQMYPLDGDSTLFTTNNKNITISRSSSDESGTIKEFETTTISKLTNEVTTIHHSKNDIRKDSVSYTNNVIKISNLVRKDSIDKNPVQTLIYEDTVIRDSNMVSKDTNDKVQNVTVEKPTIISQKSLDFIVDSLNTDYDDAKKKSKISDDDYEVIIKLPNGKHVKMKAVEEVVENLDVKEILKKKIAEKVEERNVIPKLVTSVNSVSVNSAIIPSVNSVVVPSLAGTLIPVTLVNGVISKVLIPPASITETFTKPVKRKVRKNVGSPKTGKVQETLDPKCAASRRYRARLKETYDREAQENQDLKASNEKLRAENAALKKAITDHMKTCPSADEMIKVLYVPSSEK